MHSYKFCIGRNEPEFIREIIQWVKSTLVKFQVAQDPGSRKQYVKPLLNIEKNDSTCVVSVFEIGGRDRTTIVETIHTLFASQIEGSCSIENIGETSDQKGMIHLQNSLMFQYEVLSI
jgi:hypothetical protein